MLSHHHKVSAPAGPPNPFAIAAARAMAPGRSQTPTLSQSAAAAALSNTSALTPTTSPAQIVTRRMERRNSSSSLMLTRRGSDASMSSRQFREAGASIERPSSRTSNGSSSFPDTLRGPQRLTQAANEHESPLRVGSLRKSNSVRSNRGNAPTYFSNQSQQSSTTVADVRQLERAMSPAGVSNDAVALARQMMQQPQASGEVKKIKKKKKKQVVPDAAFNETDDTLLPPPKLKDTASSGYGRPRNYAGSISSMNSFTSDLESINEEQEKQGQMSDEYQARKERNLSRSSIIVPGKGGVPDLPSSPLMAAVSPTRNSFSSVSTLSSQVKAKIQHNADAAPSGDEARAASPLNNRTIAHTIDMDPMKDGNRLSAPAIQTIPATPPVNATAMFLPDTGPKARKTSLSSARSGSRSPVRVSASPVSPSSTAMLPRRHSPPPRSSSPAKSAMKYSHQPNVYLPDTSDNSSIRSEDLHSGKRKSVRVSFSGEDNVVELNEEQYRYQPVSRNTQEKTVKKAASPSRAVGDVSFSSVGRSAGLPDTAADSASYDTRLGGSIGDSVMEKLRANDAAKSTILDPSTQTQAGSEVPAYTPTLDEIRATTKPKKSALKKRVDSGSESGNSVYSDAAEAVERTGSPGIGKARTKTDSIKGTENLPSITEVVAAEKAIPAQRKISTKKAKTAVPGAISNQPTTTQTVPKKKKSVKTAATVQEAQPVATLSNDSRPVVTNATVPNGAPVSATSGPVKTKKARIVSAPVMQTAKPPLQRTFSASSADSAASASSFQRQNARKANVSGFSMKRTMRGASAGETAQNNDFSSGLRSQGGKTGGISHGAIGRIRSYSPDSSDDEGVFGNKSAKSGSAGFFGRGTMRSSTPSQTNDRKSKPSSAPWRSRFADSSDEEEVPVQPSVARHSRIPSDSSVSDAGNTTIASTVAGKRQTAPPTVNGNGSVFDAYTSSLAGRNSLDAGDNSSMRKRWWSTGSNVGSRPGSSGGMSDVPQSQSNPRGMFRKGRKTSSNSVNSVQSNATWTASTGTGHSPNHERRVMSGLPELHEEPVEEVMPAAQAPSAATGIATTPIVAKRKRFPKLRKFFKLD